MNGSAGRHPTNNLHNKLPFVKEKIIPFLKKNVVLSVAAMLAIITSFIIPIDEKYISYFHCRK